MVVKFRKASYAEVVGYWISYEYNDRPDFRDYIDGRFSEKDVKYITAVHDYTNRIANARRLLMLQSYRRFIAWFKHADWWVVLLSKEDVSKLLVIHSPHWDLLSDGTVRALDIAEGIEKKRWKKVDGNKLLLQEPAELEHVRSVAHDEGKKILKNLKKKVRSKNPTRIVVIGAEGGKELTVIDGVHRSVRLCLYHLVRGKGEEKSFSQEAYLGLMPNPLRRTTKEWESLRDFFERERAETGVLAETPTH